MYIKYMNEKNVNLYVSYWLLLITFIVTIMIFVGGLTRLTDSGLSITKWDLFSGILPPVSPSDWDKYFTLYQQIPEYTLMNFSMTLEEFKVIFWWEYGHRLLGRLIGVLYLIPLIFFTFKKNIKGKNLFFLYFILTLIVIQGVVGWYMVKSGLSERVDVSHYRLALHLVLAFIILILVFWNYLTYRKKEKNEEKAKLSFLIPFIFLILILVQICIGAFVSGMDAGQIYQTWPLMGENFFPNDSNLNDLFSKEAFDTPSLVQFIHRNLAYIIIIYFAYIFYKIYANSEFSYLKNIIKIISIAIFLQTLLGILTIYSGANIYLASMHQVGSIFLVLSSTVMLFKNLKFNPLL